ncbi:CNNM domain-containing protein [Rosistilla carotiformis]|nr:CNNM domain-containing protein [Rosistilla carotiformis]
MLLLILMSAFFSGSEAALFSLQPLDRRRLKSNKRDGPRIEHLLMDPERLLSAVLFWNLIINMAYFGIVSIAGKRLESIGEARFAIGFTLFSLLLIIFFSEMLPKSVAVKNPTKIAVWVARPLSLSIRIVSPALPLLKFANRVAQRIIWPAFQPERELEIEDIDRAIRLSAPDDAFADRERLLLRRLVSLADVRVDEWMRPRSEYQIHQFPLSSEALQTAVEEGGYLFIGDGSEDEISGAIAVRWLRPSQMDDLPGAMEAPLIVPWSTNVANVFDELCREDRDIAAVVNEYGEIIGVISIDDVLESMVMQPDHSVNTDDGAADSVVEIAFPLRIEGSMSARELANRLQVEPPTGRNVTVAGLIQTITRRFPRLGDVCEWNGHSLLVVAELDKGKVEIEVTQVSKGEPNS